MKRIEVPPRVLPAATSTGEEDSGKIRETINNLPAYSQLQLEVLVKNVMFESEPSNRIDLTTPEGGRIPNIGFLCVSQNMQKMGKMSYFFYLRQSF